MLIMLVLGGYPQNSPFADIRKWGISQRTSFDKK
jgi:hypothetical protein